MIRSLLSTSSLLLCAAVASGCVPSVTLEVLQPAQVALPAHVKKVAIIDRSHAANAAQGTLAVLEGAVTGEAPGVDNMGRQEALHGLTDTLRESPRVEVILPAQQGMALEPDLFGRTMSWEAATKLCKQAGCDAIISLEGFDSNYVVLTGSRMEDGVDENGKERRYRVFTAHLDSSVNTAWRVYDVKKKTLADDLQGFGSARSADGEAEVEVDAIAVLPPQGQIVQELAFESGVAYARRIAPTYVLVSRSYYVKGDDLLKEAKNHVKASDWEGAAALWEQAAQSPDPEIKGKAHFNLALAREVEGDLPGALALAKQAAIELGNNRSRSYVGVIQQRLDDAARLEKQLAPVTPAPAPEPPPLTPPTPDKSGRR